MGWLGPLQPSRPRLLRRRVRRRARQHRGGSRDLQGGVHRALRREGWRGVRPHVRYCARARLAGQLDHQPGH